MSDERGLANCPAKRPTFTTGTPAPKVSYVTKVGDQVCAVGYYK